MLKKTSKILSVLITLTMIMSLVIQPLYATTLPNDPGIELQWQNAKTINIALSLSNPKISISINALGFSGTKFKNGRVVLEKLNGSKYETVKEWTGLSSNTPTLIFNDSSVDRSKGTYRVTFSVNAVRNNVTEPISGTRSATY